MNRPCRMGCLGLCLLAISSPAFAGQPVRVGIYQNSPKVALADTGQPEGIFVDLIEDIAAKENWSLEYVQGTWAEGLDRLAQGKIDLMPDVALTREREEQFAFHREPVLSDWFQIYAPKESGIRSLPDLDGKKVAVLEHSVQQDAFEEITDRFDLAVDLVPMPDYQNAFGRVAQGQVHAVIANRFYGAAHIQKNGIEDTAIIFNPTRLYFAAPLAGNPSRLEAIDRHLKEMKANPSSIYYRSLKRWTSEEPGFRVPGWAKAAGTIAVVFLLVSLFWNAALKYRVSIRTRELKQQNEENTRLCQRMSESRERFETLFEANPSGLMLIERSTRIIQQVNAATAEMIGRPAHEIVGKICHGFMCPAESTTCPICDLGQQIDRSERILIQANGNTLPILKTVVPITLNGTAYLLESFIDISQRKQAEERLRFHAQLLGSVREAVVASDLEGRIVYWSRGAEKLFGYSSDEVMNRPYRDFAGSLVPPDEETFRREIMANGTWRGEHRQKNRKGEVFWTSSFISLVLDEQGKPSGFIGIDADITDRKQAQKESEQLQLQLAQAHKMESVGRLAGGVAHDFNNMLGAILGHAEIALESVPPGHPLHGDLVEIQKAAKRSADLTRQLLAFARKQTVAPQVIDLNETVAGMLNMLRRLIGENIDLVWAPNPELGRVKVDPSQIDQILANLCVNARDAIAGKGTLTIETARITFDEAECAQHAGFVPGEYAMLSVRDDGCGMDNETQVNLFEPFFTTKGVGQGTGLGLATVYGIVKQNHGFICVESAPGKGSTFQIYLPRHLGVQDSPAGAHAAKPASPGQATVLVVEDEPAILQITRTMLTRLGYQVLGAATPGEAIHLAETHSGAIHLLMTDVVMPEMNGRDLAKNLLSLYPHIKRLFMSGYTADVIAHHGVLHEGVEFIQKPFSMKELADKVREALADSGGS